MLKIVNKTITLTRSDSAIIQLVLTDANGEAYVPAEGDAIRFALKKNYSDFRCLIQKSIPTNTLILEFEPSDTHELDFGNYKYDIQLTRTDGTVDTFIDRGDFYISEEVQ